MSIPLVRGVIDRRILVNYRADPGLVSRLLPAPFRPCVIHGHSLVGICLIRLKQIRPAFLPAWMGIESENAAHRVAVLWDDEGTTRSCVYVFRRDTGSRLNALAGGRVFPGRHQLARFAVDEARDRFDVGVWSHDETMQVEVRAHRTTNWPENSIFESLNEASTFFEAGSIGFSPTRFPHQFQGLRLNCRHWRIDALEVEEARSSVFDDAVAFPNGSIALDCALLMEDVEHEWSSLPDLTTSGSRALCGN